MSSSARLGKLTSWMASTNRSIPSACSAAIVSSRRGVTSPHPSTPRRSGRARGVGLACCGSWMARTQDDRPRLPEGGRRRVMLEAPSPEVDGGRYPAKRIIGDTVLAECDLLADGHD